MDAIYENPNFLSVCEFLPNHLYFVTVQNINNGGSCDAIIPHTEDIHYFNTDNELIYHNFYGDFGPLSILCLYKFCKKLTNKLATYVGDAFCEKFKNSRFGRKDIAEKLQEKFIKKKIVVYYTSTNNEKRANAAFLIAAFAVLYLEYSPRLAYKALQPTKLRYRAFQDASIGLSPYKITMKDCLDALHKASTFGFFNFGDFNAAEYSYYENIEHGDLNWIIPQKFIAFPGPVEEKNDYYHHPNFYIEYFLCNNVTDVIRLNQRAYDPKCFTMFNIKHHDLYMQDGTDPPDAILKSFLKVVESAKGAIAVHCKAGLGRTGSLIGAYLLKHYRMTAKEAIAWIRICRPGSVIGHQQTWLENHEEILWYEGNEWRYKVYGKTEIVPFLPFGIYSLESPKKEFPGLKDLLANLTKKSRYRFIVKNRSKKSKMKLQTKIKNLLEQGSNQPSKEFKDERKDKREDKSDTSSVQNSNYELPTPRPPPSSMPTLRDIPKNFEYLKVPPKVEPQEQPQEPINYEYSNQSYRKPIPTKIFSNNFEPTPSFNNFPPKYPSYESKIPTYVYPNQNPYYSNFSYPDYPQYNPYPPIPVQRPQMPKAFSEQITPRYEDVLPNNLQSKSIDRNWKDPKCFGKRRFNKNVEAEKPAHEEVCAFDSRVDTISQYSRFNKPFLNKSYSNQNSNDDYYSEMKLKGYDYTQSERSNGFLLSPEDLQSWVETFGDKVDETFGKPFEMKRSSVT